jgi:uncharacterized secreted protein with C-terminal beta-propeller domain
MRNLARVNNVYQLPRQPGPQVQVEGLSTMTEEDIDKTNQLLTFLLEDENVYRIRRIRPYQIRIVQNPKEEGLINLNPSQLMILLSPEGTRERWAHSFDRLIGTATLIK